MRYLIIIVLYSLMGLITYQFAKRCADSEDPIFAGVFWPIYWPIAFLCFFSVLVFRAGFQVVKISDKVIDWTCERGRSGLDLNGLFKKKIPEISIPKNAVINSEQYRELKDLIEKYEQNLPVCER